MNNQEVMNLIRQLLTLVGGLLAGAGVLNAAQSNTIVSDVMTAVPALISLGSVCWSVYAHWNMKKVSQGALVVKPGTPVPPSSVISSRSPGPATMHLG